MELFHKFLLFLRKNKESCHWLFWSVGMGLVLFFAFFLRFLFLLRFGFVLLSKYCAFKFLSQLLRMVLLWLWFVLFLLLRLLLDISDRFRLLIFDFLFHWFDLVDFFLINSSIGQAVSTDFVDFLEGLAQNLRDFIHRSNLIHFIYLIFITKLK
jgi:hypothetical protein